MPKNIRERIEKLAPVFEQHGVLLAYLFGSLARGDKAEDVDIAVLMEGAKLEDLREEIIQRLGTDRVDLLDLNFSSPTRRFEVLRSGRLIYRRNIDIENDFELSVLREYKDTEYLRRKQRQVLKERTELWCSGWR